MTEEEKKIVEGLHFVRKEILNSHGGNWVSGSKKVYNMCLIDNAIAYIENLNKPEEEKKSDE